MIKKGILKITDKRMTRFNITLSQGVKFVLNALENCLGQEIFVPKLPSYNILDLAKAVSKNAKIIFTGIRQGEKLHEEMITISDSFNTIENKDYYIILPGNLRNKNVYLKKFKAKQVKETFSYNSLDNLDKMNTSQLKKLININS